MSGITPTLWMCCICGARSNYDMPRCARHGCSFETMMRLATFDPPLQFPLKPVGHHPNVKSMRDMRTGRVEP